MMAGRCTRGCSRAFIGQRGRRAGFSPPFWMIDVGLVGWASPTQTFYWLIGEVVEDSNDNPVLTLFLCACNNRLLYFHGHIHAQ